MRQIGVGTFLATDKMKALVSEVLNTNRISHGPMCRQFEQRFADLHDCKFAVTSNSGTDSLRIALQTLKEIHRWPDGDEVIVPAVTFVATVNIVLQCNMAPVLVDVEPRMFGIDTDKIPEAFTDKTRAIIPVHLFGMPCDMDRLTQVVPLKNVKIIEDSCFTGNTLVSTKRGQIHIKDVKAGDKLLGFDGTTFKETTVINTMNRLVNYKELLVIKFENGTVVRCTKEHPFFVDGKWVSAKNLNVNDEAWQASWSEYTTWRRGYKLTERGRKAISQNMRDNNPMFNPEVVKKSALSRVRGPSLIEKGVMTTCSEYNLPIEYTGGGNFWVGSDRDGYKNPDFIVSGEKKVIEVYDPTFHYHGGTGIRGDEWEKARSCFFTKHGYKTKFVALNGFVGPSKRAALAQDLRQFISNGVKVVSIKPTKGGFVKRYNSGVSEPSDMVRVYNLFCEPQNNFILSSGILVHNCETMFAHHRNRKVGSWGDIACFSTYVAHLIVSGVGGIAITNNPDYAAKMRSLINHGRDGIYTSIDDDDLTGDDLREVVSRRFNFESIGYSSRITEMECALAVAQLDDWQEMIAKRQWNAAYLMDGLRHLEDRLQLPEIRPHTSHSFMMFPIVLRDNACKWNLCNYLEERGIETRELMRLTDQPCYKGLWNPDDYPVARMLNKSGLYVGIHQGLTREDLDYMIEVIGDYFEQ